MRNILTVDVEEYFHPSEVQRSVGPSEWDRLPSRVEGQVYQVLQLLDRHKVSATFFILGWVAERHPGLIRRIAATGHEVASHGYEHRLVFEMTPEEFRQDLRRAKRVLEDAVGVPIQGFRAPSYSITARSSWALDILIEEGYEYDASVFPIHHDRYGIPSAPRHPNTVTRATGAILEIPASTIRLGTVNVPIAGGGYFRLMPYWWTRWACRRVNRRERRPIVFYLHPWEIDPAQPRLSAPWLSRFRHYQNLEKTAPRLRRLLADFCFDSIGAAILGSVSAATPAGVSDAPAAATLAQRG